MAGRMVSMLHWPSNSLMVDPALNSFVLIDYTFDLGAEFRANFVRSGQSLRQLVVGAAENLRRRARLELQAGDVGGAFGEGIGRKHGRTVGWMLNDNALSAVIGAALWRPYYA
jgi:hypothetical protein